MRRIVALIALAGLAAAGPSDFLRYEATKDGARVTIRTHAHAVAAEGYRPVSAEWADLPKILGLSVPPAKESGKLQFNLALDKLDVLKVKGEFTVKGGQADISYKFSTGDGAPRGTAVVSMQFDPVRRIVRSSTLSIEGIRLKDTVKTAFQEKWTFKLDRERIHGTPGFQNDVDSAIAKGVAYLKGKQQEDGSFSARAEYAIGTTALCVFTLSSCGVPRDDPVIEKSLAHLVAQTPPSTYDRAVALMALDRAYTPPDEMARAHRHEVQDFKRDLPPARREWALRVADDLERFASAPGSWHYGKRMGEDWPDSSNTQYAVLGLRAAAKIGYQASPRTWLGVLQHFRTLRGREEFAGTVTLLREGEAVTQSTTSAGAKVSKKDGNGFRYRGDYPGTTATMTTAAIASLLIAREELERLGQKLNARKSGEIDRAVLGAWLWLSRNWAMARVPGHIPWYHRHYYYLYAVERAAVLDRVKRVDDHDWYFEGAAWLLDQQHENGAWDGEATTDDVNTCFALLFLKRATAPLTLTR